ncbi:MAG: hypothetical protein IPH74_02890 [Bacteroidetes bacterium]|nr:hypothetical protein [Bacteroidota bacterium]
MQDLLRQKGLKIDTAKLSEVLGISVVPITARKERDRQINRSTG